MRRAQEQNENGHVRVFAGAEISKVKFLQDSAENPEFFVTGTWNPGCAEQQNSLSLWKASADGPNGLVLDVQRRHKLAIGNANVHDIFVVNASQFVASFSSGDVRIVDVNASEEHLIDVETYRAVHRTFGSAALCVLNDEIFSGGENGQIVRIAPSAGNSRDSVSTFAENLMGVRCMASCGAFQFASGHSTGQIHLWDVRQNAAASTSLPAIFANTAATSGRAQPIVSRPVTVLNNAITAIASHSAQPNLVAFGTEDGSVGFIDIRRTDEPLPNIFKVSKGRINQIKFHPIFANNCFSASENGVIHWDASSFSAPKEISAPTPARNLSAGSPMDEDDAVGMGGLANVWLSGRAWTSVQLKAVLEDDPRLVSSFDVAHGALIIGTDTANLVYLGNLNFSN